MDEKIIAAHTLVTFLYTSMDVILNSYLIIVKQDLIFEHQ